MGDQSFDRLVEGHAIARALILTRQSERPVKRNRSNARPDRQADRTTFRPALDPDPLGTRLARRPRAARPVFEDRPSFARAVAERVRPSARSRAEPRRPARGLIRFRPRRAQPLSLRLAGC
jgi:hypothetical protein